MATVKEIVGLPPSYMIPISLHNVHDRTQRPCETTGGISQLPKAIIHFKAKACGTGAYFHRYTTMMCTRSTHLKLHVIPQRTHNLHDLLRQFASRCEHQRLALRQLYIDFL